MRSFKYSVLLLQQPGLGLNAGLCYSDAKDLVLRSFCCSSRVSLEKALSFALHTFALACLTTCSLG